MAVAADLQRQCHDLLNQLKTNQMTLRQSFAVRDTQPVSLINNLETQFSSKKPEYARKKLKSIMKQKSDPVLFSLGGEGKSQTVCSTNKSVNDKIHIDVTNSPLKIPEVKNRLGTERQTRLIQGEQPEDQSKNDAMHDYFGARTTDSLMEGGTDSFIGPVSSEDNTERHGESATPAYLKHRSIIDRNVHVDSKLSEADLRELEKDIRGLNFSYSQGFDDEDTTGLDDEDTTGKNFLLTAQDENQSNNNNKTTGGDNKTAASIEYHQSLVDRGNNRQLNNFIKDTTIKPKSLLNSTQSFSRSYSKQGPGVSLHNSTSSSGNGSLFRSQAGERRMLGYDWIAALIDNDAGLMNESESYFHELREFRRCNRDECCNDFYMEGPFTLLETEPAAVEKAINETKVQPYTVNERLFTVPVTENLLGQPLDNGHSKGQQAEPSQDNPRFVRVSIPRSTLQLPYKVKAHRRRSFDASDSCSLTDHCLMGWSAVSPATLPTASSVSLTDAVAGVNPKHATTMAEAEKAASTFHWPLLTDPQPKSESLPTWRKQFTDSTLNFHPDTSSLSLSSSLEGRRPGNIRQKTDALLNSTYSMMYEMQRARELRENERLKQSAEAAS